MAEMTPLWLYNREHNILTPKLSFTNTLVEGFYARPNGQYSANINYPWGLLDNQGGCSQYPHAQSMDNCYILTDDYCILMDCILDSYQASVAQGYWDSTLRQSGTVTRAFTLRSVHGSNRFYSIFDSTINQYIQGSLLQYMDFLMYKDAQFTELTPLGDYWTSNIDRNGAYDAADKTAKYTICKKNDNYYLAVGCGKLIVSERNYGGYPVIYLGNVPFDRNNALPGRFTSPAYTIQTALTLNTVDPYNHIYGTQLTSYLRQKGLPNPDIVSNSEFEEIVGQSILGDDPLKPAGYSGSADGGVPGVQPDGTNAGGDGTFTLDSDDVPESTLPPTSSSLIGAGCGTVYCDLGPNVRSLMSYMWTHADDIIANLKKIIANPIDSILGLHIVPVVPSVGSSTQVYLGNVGTGVNMTPVTNPYLRYRLGSLVINKYWGSALDFSPFTQFNIHLPYVGFRQLNTDDLMGSTVELYYDIDVVSGACVAHLKVTRTDPLTKETHIVDQYSWAGNCAMQVPVTSTNYQSLYSFIFNSAVSVGMAVATGAAGMVGGTMTAGQLAATVGQSLSTTANNLFNGGSKIRVEKSGNVNGAHGFLDSQYAYIERITPRQSLASNYRQVLGYPSNTTQILGTCTGFTQIEDINLENFNCTADEKNELERLLKGGVIF